MRRREGEMSNNKITYKYIVYTCVPIKSHTIGESLAYNNTKTLL